ncbi:MAG: hypothetical protein IPM00_07155 [Tetrasphaera sp.]|nr:hypothetical protein [Tetrasphaera sp.]
MVCLSESAGSTDIHPTRKERPMCRAVTCKTCGKTTWAGCGQHVDQVMRDVPKAQQCAGHENEPAASGFLGKLFGR